LPSVRPALFFKKDRAVRLTRWPVNLIFLPIEGINMSEPHNLFGTLQKFELGNGRPANFYSLPALEQAGIGPISQLPVSIRLVLESVLRNCDGLKVQEANIRELANWKPNETRTAEIPFVVARIVLQDFTGVPLLVDLAAMRTAVAKLGKNPKLIEPLVPVDLVVDHSVQVDFAGAADSMARNLDLEFSRNRERYQFLKWGMQAFDTFKVVPPGIGIVHQVNLEYLAKGVLSAHGVYYPDTLVGTDSHTTMINGMASSAGAWAASRPRPACSASPSISSPRMSLASTSPARSRKVSPPPIWH